MDSNILKKAFKEILARGNIVDGLFIASAQNVSFDWESEDKDMEESEETFQIHDGAILDNTMLIISQNAVTLDTIPLLAKEIEEDAKIAGKKKLKIVFPLVYVTCKVSEISDIFGEKE